MKSASFIFDRRLYELLQEPGRTTFTTRELRDAYAARLNGTHFRIADVRRYVYEQIRRLVRAGWVALDEDRRVRGQVYHLQPIPAHLQLELIDNGFESSLMAAGVPEPDTAVRDVEALPANTDLQLEALHKEIRLDFLTSMGEAGEPAELGKNRTLRFSELPQRPEFPVFQLAALPPNVIAGQVDVLPAQWRKVLQ